MNKYNNPRLLNTVVSGTGMKHPMTPHVVVGDQSNGFIRGDLMDANAVIDQITQSTALLNLTVNSIMTDLSALNKAFSDTGISENNITLMCDADSGYAGKLNIKVQDGDSFNIGDIMYSMYGDTLEFYRRETASDVLNGEYTQIKYASLEDIIDAGNSVVVEDTHVNNSVYYGDEICVGRLRSTGPLYTRTITYTITDQDADWKPYIRTLSDFDRIIDLPTDIDVKTIEVLSGNVSWYSSVSNDLESSAPINDVFKLLFTKSDFSGSSLECHCNIDFRASLASTAFDPAGDGADTIDIRFTIRYAKEV